MKIHYKKVILGLILFANGTLNICAQSHTITYINDNSIIANPERGFHTTSNPNWPSSGTHIPDYELTTNSWTNPLDEQRLKSDRISHAITLHSMRYHLSMFRNAPLSNTFLDRLNEDCLKARNAGIKLIVRFTYSWIGCRPDATKDRIIQHLGQLKSYFETNKDVIAWVDAGFVGCWGEWHDSQSNLLSGTYGDDINSNSRTILDSLFNSVPKSRMIQFRYPRQKSQYFHPGLTDPWMDNTPMPQQNEAYNRSNISRAGNHNDVFRAEDYINTWGDYGWNAEVYLVNKTRVIKENLSVVQSGEMDKGFGNTLQLIGCNGSKNEFKSFHWTAFNLEDGGGSGRAEYYNGSTLSEWRNGGCFDEISRNLGYRLQLKSFKTPTKESIGKLLKMEFTISNVGYASVMNPRNVEVIFRHNSTLAEIRVPVNCDPRSWKADSTYTVKIDYVVGSNFINGAYSLFLNFPDSEPTLKNRPEYSIRLANKNMWEPTTGYNSLQTILRINENETTDRTDPVGSGNISVRGEHPGNANERRRQAFDNNARTKWLDFSARSWMSFQFDGSARYAVNKYTITSANDAPGRDPRDWKLYGTNVTTNPRFPADYTLLDTQSNVLFNGPSNGRFLKKEFTIGNNTAYRAYRLEITANRSAGSANPLNIIQLAEIELFAPPCTTCRTASAEVESSPQPEAFTLKLHPNPANSEVTISLDGFEGESAVQVELTDMTGKLFVREQVQLGKGVQLVTLPISHLPQGLFLVRVQGSKAGKTAKLIITK